MGEYVVCWDSLTSTSRWVSGYGRVCGVLGLFDEYLEMGKCVWGCFSTQSWVSTVKLMEKVVAVTLSK